jgi:chromosome segregation ATPase
MARVGISKLVVEKARTALIARGLNPSIDAIRIELGNTGSKSTIHRYLKELEQAEGTLAQGMGSISEELTALVQGLAARLHDEAQARIDTAQEGFDEHRARLQGEANEHAHRAETLQQALGQREEALAATLQQLREAQAKAQAEHARNARLAQACEDLDARLADKQQQIASLEEKHLHARDTLEAYRATSQAQHEQAQRRHEAQVHELQTHLQHAQQAVAAQQDDMTRLNRDNERLLSALTQSEQHCAAMAAQGAQLQGDIARVSALHGQAEGARTVLDRQLAEAGHALRKAEERLFEQGRMLAEAQVRQQLAEQALLDTRATLAPAEAP